MTQQQFEHTPHEQSKQAEGRRRQQRHRTAPHSLPLLLLRRVLLLLAAAPVAQAGGWRLAARLGSARVVLWCGWFNLVALHWRLAV